VASQSTFYPCCTSLFLSEYNESKAKLDTVSMTWAIFLDWRTIKALRTVETLSEYVTVRSNQPKQGADTMSNARKIQGITCYGKVTESSSYIVAGYYREGGEFEDIVSCVAARTWSEVVAEMAPWAERNGIEIVELSAD